MASANKTGLLRTAGSSAQSVGEGHARRVPQARAQISSGPESRATNPPKKNSSRFRKPTKFFPTQRNARCTTSSGSTCPEQGGAPGAGGAQVTVSEGPEDIHFDFGGFDFGGGAPGLRAAAQASAIFLARSSAARKAQAGPREREPGTDLEYQIDITFAEAMRGTVKKLSFTRLDTCNVCHGSGNAPGDEKVCPAAAARAT
jgi:hypothetical protein